MDQLFPVTSFCKKVVFAYTNPKSLPKHKNYSEITFRLSFLVKVGEYNHFFSANKHSNLTNKGNMECL